MTFDLDHGAVRRNRKHLVKFRPIHRVRDLGHGSDATRIEQNRGFEARVIAGAIPAPQSQIRRAQSRRPHSGTNLIGSDRDSYSVTALADITDRSLHAAIARFTAGMSPASLAEAYLDWLTHLTYAPGKRAQLVDKAIRKAIRFANYASRYAIEGGKNGMLHRTAAAGSPVQRRSLAKMAVQLHLPGFSAAAAMVAQRDDRRARRFANDTKRWSSSPRARSSTWSRHRIFC